MASRTARLNDFTTDDAPNADSLVEVLCEDHVGTYLLPYMCRSTQEGFRNDRTGELIQARVVGWRAPIRRPRKRGGGARGYARRMIPPRAVLVARLRRWRDPDRRES
jgi:hypothetical protein